jgi:hypothetical protein
VSGHPLDRLRPRGKPPATARAIETWIQTAEREAGIGASRLGWMVASGILIAAVQRVKHIDGLPRFLIKGGAYLELRLGLKARATKDIDVLFRGNFDDFLAMLDEALAEPFDGITFVRTEPEVIEAPGRRIKPRRFDVRLQLKGRTWRRIRVEVSADEAGAGDSIDTIETPSLAHFGISTPPTTAGIVVDYQVAQKLHACTDPHSDHHPNDRVRDVVDLVLLKALFPDDADLSSLATACRRLFEGRAREAEETGEIEPRSWPPQITAHRHWQSDYRSHAEEVDLDLSLKDAVTALDDWISAIDQSQ